MGAPVGQSENDDRTRADRHRGGWILLAAQPVDGTASGISCRATSLGARGRRVRNWSFSPVPNPPERARMLGGRDPRRALQRRAHEEAPAIAYGVETSPTAVVPVNELRVPTGRAEDLDGIVAARGTMGLDFRRHARTVSHRGERGHRPKGTQLLGRKSRSDYGLTVRCRLTMRPSREPATSLGRLRAGSRPQTGRRAQGSPVLGVPWDVGPRDDTSDGQTSIPSQWNLDAQPAKKGAEMPRTPGMHARTLPASGSSAIWASVSVSVAVVMKRVR